MTKKTDSKTKKTKTATASVANKKKGAKKPAQKASAVTTAGNTSTVNAAALATWNKWVAFLYLVQAAMLVVMAKTYALPVTMTYLTKDTFASQDGEDPVFAPAVRHLFDINITYTLAALLAVAAIVHIAYATVYKKRYEKELDAGVNRMRWASYGLIVSGVVSVAALTLGLYDLTVIIPLIALTLLASLAGLAVEVYAQRKNRRRLAYVIAGFAAVVPWVVLGSSVAVAGVVSNDNIPAEAYGVVVGSVLSLLLFAVAFTKRFRGKGKWQQYMHAERAYSMTLFVLLTLVTWILFAGGMQP